MEKCKAEARGDGNAQNDNVQMNNAENDDRKMSNVPNALVEEVANPHKFKCRKCPVQAQSIILLKKHEEIHNRRGNPSYPINCDYCDASFDNRNGLVAHERVHKDEKEPRMQLARQTTVKITAKSENTTASKINGGQSNGTGSTRILRTVVRTKRTRPQANNVATGDDDNLEINGPAKQKLGRPRKLVPPAGQIEVVAPPAAAIEVAPPTVVEVAPPTAPVEVAPPAAPVELAPANANAVDPLGVISSIVKECSKSNSLLYDIDFVNGTIGKIQFQCKPGPSSLR